MDKKYKKMLAGMKAKETAKPPRKAEPWFLYVLECVDGSFYTGISNNIERRLEKHNKGTASKYTRTRRPVKLLYQETWASRTQAMVRECAVKTLSKKQKVELVHGKPPASRKTKRLRVPAM